MILVDTNVLLDVIVNDPQWADWSERQLEARSTTDILAINAIIYSELSVGFARIEELESLIRDASLAIEEIPREALFLACKAFLRSRRRRGTRRGVLHDFFIGAHAAVRGWPLLTRDADRYQAYFPSLRLLTPDRLQ